MRRALVAFALSTTMVCAVGLGVCLWGRGDFWLGSALGLIRWPAVLALFGAGLMLLAMRRRLASGVAVAVAIGFVAERLAMHLTRARPPGSPNGPTISVLTHNVLYRGADPPVSLAALEEASADILALQEMTPQWAADIEARLGRRYPYRTLSLQHGTLGYAVYSRHPLDAVRYLGFSQQRAFAQCMDVRVPGAPVVLCNVHFHSPASALRRDRLMWKGLEENARLRSHQWRELERHVDARAGDRPRILAGDFNTGDYEPLYREMTAGYVDAFRHLRWTPGFTWPNRAKWPPFPVVRIDYILVRSAAPVIASVLPKSGSDHLAVKAVLRLDGEHPAVTSRR